MARKCASCGHEIPDYANECPECGEAGGVETVTDFGMPEEYEEMREAKKKERLEKEKELKEERAEEKEERKEMRASKKDEKRKKRAEKREGKKGRKHGEECTCPNCGNAIRADEDFCPKCGLAPGPETITKHF